MKVYWIVAALLVTASGALSWAWSQFNPDTWHSWGWIAVTVWSGLWGVALGATQESFRRLS